MNTKHKFIGVIGSCLHEQNAMNFLSALSRSCKQYGYTSVAFSASVSSILNEDSAQGHLKFIELLKYIKLDCLIILTESIKSRSIIDKIVSIGNEKNIPIFSVDGTIEGCYNMLQDYNHGFRDVVRHVIIDHKLSRVNMIAGIKGNSFSDERVDIFKSVLEECNIPFEEERLGYGEFWDRPTRAAIKKFLNSGLEMPEAIICANDIMAVTTCSVLSEHGYRIPEDIIVTGFDGIQSGKYNSPTITTCEPDYDDAMNFIMQEVHRFLSTGLVSPCNHMIKFTLSKNQSCGCLPNVTLNHAKVIASFFDDIGDSTWHTVAMNTFVTSISSEKNISVLPELVQEATKLWSQNFRFACVKSHLTDDNYEENRSDYLAEDFSNMTTILNVQHGDYDMSSTRFDVEEFIPNIDNIISEPGTTLLVRIINNGQQVFGYTIDEFTELTQRNLQRCNEFDMFVSHSLSILIHNYELHKLHQNLEQAYKDIEALSVHDPMTGVYNRRGFYNKITPLLKLEEHQNKYLYVVFVDLDGLKGINDCFGHKEGDFAIKIAAKALANVNVDTPLCARFGGDEFILTFFADNYTDFTAESINLQIQENIKKLTADSKKVYPIKFSLGVLCQLVNKINDIEDIILSADKMMYVNKISKRKP